jgi:cytochrome c553
LLAEARNRKVPNTRNHLYILLKAASAVLLFAIAPSSNAEEPPSAPLDSIQQRAQPCMACHGKEGRATPEGYYPRIAGKPSGYLFNQLTNFRAGRRHFAMMTYMVERQNDAFLHELADYFGNLRLPYANRDNSSIAPALLARGRALVTEGDEAQRVPACQSCHSKSLLGTSPAVPGLLGLSPDYVIGQLGAWRNGTRHAHEPDCMADIAKQLRSEDIAAVAWWLAGEQVPAEAAPAADFENPPSIECGSFRTASGTR